MASYIIQSETLTAIGDAIREKTGSTASMTPQEMAAAIYTISGGSSTTANITVNGAVSETVTALNKSTGLSHEVLLDSAGTGTMTNIPFGTYTFTGSVSGYIKEVTVEANGIVNVMPDGLVLYWYGRFGIGFDATGSKIATGAAALKQTNLLFADVAQSNYGGLYLTPTVKRGSYTKLKAVAKLYPQNGNLQAGVVGLTTSTADVTSNTTNFVTGGYSFATISNVYTEYTIDVSGISATSEYYFRLNNYGNDCGLKAAWFESEDASPAYTNQIPISTDASGAVFNGTGKQEGIYLNGYSTAEQKSSGHSWVSGFIPITKGDVIRIHNYFRSDFMNSEWCGLAFYNSDKTLNRCLNNLESTFLDNSGHLNGSYTKTPVESTQMCNLEFTFDGTSSMYNNVKYFRLGGTYLTNATDYATSIQEAVVTVNEVI